MGNPKYKAKGYLRTAKNFTKGYSDIEIKVRDATSNDPNGPPTTLLEQLAAASNHHYLFMDMMKILDKRLNDKGKNWRHVYKSLIVLDYLLLAGSDQVLAHLQDQIYIIKTLLHFQYVDELGRDHGSCVRQKTKDLLELIENPDQVSTRRNNPQLMNAHSFLAYNEATYGTVSSSPSTGWSRSHPNRPTVSSSVSGLHYSNQEDAQLQQALEASRQQAILDAQNRASKYGNDENDLELQAALKISAAEASSKKNSNNDLIDLFQGPPSVSEVQRDLASLSVGPTSYMTKSYYSYQYPNNPHATNSSCSSSMSYLTSSCPPNGVISYSPNTPNTTSPYLPTSAHSNPQSVSEDPFEGLSNVLKSSTSSFESSSPDEYHFKRHVVPQKPAIYGAIPPNSIPTPFEVAAIVKDEENEEPTSHRRA